VEYTEAEISQMMDVNLKGTILGSQAALRAMSLQRSGQIINIISTASLRGIPGETVYCAAKWGVRGFTQGLREEAAAVGVRVTAVLPGGVDTDFWKDATERSMPVQDFLTAEQVANAVLSIMQMEENVVPQELVIRALRDRDFAQAP
jgi:NADP-dependent 3-hydroxy acid dehydrogenase YdfG